MDPPVGTNGDTPIASQVAPQRVQPETRQVELFWPSRHIEPRQHPGDFVGVLRIHFPTVVVFIKATQAAMSKSPDHSLLCIETIVTCQSAFGLLPLHSPRWANGSKNGVGKSIREILSNFRPD